MTQRKKDTDKARGVGEEERTEKTTMTRQKGRTRQTTDDRRNKEGSKIRQNRQKT